MKKGYKLVAAVGLAFITIGVTAQQMSVVKPKGALNISKLKGSIRHPHKALATGTYVLNYDSADAAIWQGLGNQYVHDQGEVMNIHYAYPADTTGNFTKPTFSQNNNCIDYVTVAFDSIWDPYQFAGVSSKTVTNIQIDTIYVPFVQVNTSGKNDTLEVDINTVDIYGYPTSTVKKDTMVIGTNIGLGDQFIANLAWGANYVLNGSKFAVTLKFHGSKLDTCWFIYGFGSFSGNCSGAGPFTLADTTNYSIIGIKGGGKFWANSMLLYNQYVTDGTLPTNNGGNLFYDCNGDGKFDAGDGAAYEENINVFAMVTTNPVGINEISSANGLSVAQNYPNPFSKATQITYSLDKSSDVSFNVYDMTGRKLISNSYSEAAPGQHVITLNANQFTPGVYFYTFDVNGSTVTKKMIITE
jgi:hypothetical protein